MLAVQNFRFHHKHTQHGYSSAPIMLCFHTQIFLATNIQIVAQLKAEAHHPFQKLMEVKATV